MSLVNYLKRAGLVTGPSLSYTGHTRLGMIKSILLGAEVRFDIDPEHQKFGRYLHERFLLGKSKIKVTPEQLKNAEGMLKSLNNNKIVKMLMVNTECEVTKRIKLRGINFQYTPDAVQLRTRGRDLKTSSCKTEQDFIEKAFQYGYFRQDVAYSEAHRLKEFVIIGIQKYPPYQVYITVPRNYKDLYDYAKQEFDFLIYFYKHYGNFFVLDVNNS